MNFFKYSIAYLLAVGLCFFIAPAVSAADSEPVLLSVGHQRTDTVTLSGPAYNAVLTVPYGYLSDSVDLYNGLSITYDKTRYKSVVAIPDAEAAVDGAAVSLTVTYLLIGDPEEAPKSQTVYAVRIVRAAPLPPNFTGSITKAGASPGTISFLSSDFTAQYSQNDGNPLGFICISGSNLSVGKLQLAGSDYILGAPVAIDSIHELTFSALSGGTVSYDVTAYTDSDTTHPVGTAVLTITVSPITPPSVQSSFTGTLSKGSTRAFSASDFTGLCNLNGGTLRSVEIIPTNTAYGNWYLGASAVSGTTAVDASLINTLSFTAKEAGAATFKWRVSNESGFSSYGTGTITVSSPALTLSPYTASTPILKGSTWTINAGNFRALPAAAGISYVKITSIPPSADGYLYLTIALPADSVRGYPAIAANKALSAGAILPYEYLNYVRLSTKSGGTGGLTSFTWSATAESIVSGARWAAPVSYTVSFVSAGGVSLETDLNTPVTLSSSDFHTQFYQNTGYPLSCVTFTLPANTSGIFYYNYDIAAKKGTKVSASTKYYIGASPNLSYVTFVPAADYTGTVNIPYNAYTADGIYTSGTLTITISNSPGGTLTYVTDKNAPLQLDAKNFSSAFLNATGKALSYVEFSLPSSYYGKLYYDFTSLSNYDSTVSSIRKYYVYSSPYLSYITFLPYEDYTGTVTIRFTGYAENGGTYEGKLKICVVDSPAGIVTYTTGVNGAVQLMADDFADEFISVTGSVLSCLSFAPPAATSGVLYYDYSLETKKGTKVGSSTKYYNGSNPDISAVTFVSAADYVGTVVVSYTAYVASGASYAGKLKIIVGEAGGGSLSYSTGASTPFSLKAGDFSNKFAANTGGAALSYVQFVLPSASYGKFYYNYNSSASYGTAVSPSTRYYTYASPNLSNITFVPYAGYSGSFIVTYTGYTADGTGYTGKMKITVGSDTVGNVNYRTNARTAVTFRTTDFQTAYENETGRTLSYIKFTSLPSSAIGKLYYNYSSSLSYSSLVSYSTKYYQDFSPYLSSVTFVPNTDYTGVVTIDYTAFDYEGNPSPGVVTITVGGADGGTINYETDKNTPIPLDGDDFSSSFMDITKSSLSYVRFTLPSPSLGKLYYNYTSSSQYGSVVSSYTSYYTDAYPYLSNITFVPAADYFGPVTISYDAYNLYGNSYAGVLLINIRQVTAGSVTIETDKNTPIGLNSDDLGFAFASETGSALQAVSFTPPADSYGRLYLGYTSSESYFSEVTASSKYYKTSSPLLSDVTFVPRTGFVGTVTIAYKGYTSSGKSYDGELHINVTDPEPFLDMGPNYAWAHDAVTYLYKNQIVAGTPERLFLPGANMTRGNLILMVSRAYDLGEGTADNFTDVAPGSYYYKAIGAAKALGIAQGSGGKFNPDADISRQDAMVIVLRLLSVIGKKPEAGSASDLSLFTDVSDISDYALEAVSSLVKAGVIAGGSDGRLHPKDSISRAEMAVILYRILTM